MQAREPGDELLAQRRAGRVVKSGASARHPGQRRLTLDLLHQEEWRTEDLGRIAIPIDAWHRDAAMLERLERDELGNRAVGPEDPIGRTDTCYQLAILTLA